MEAAPVEAELVIDDYVEDTAVSLDQSRFDSEFPLEAAAEAQDKMLASDFFGKIVLRP